MNDTFTPDMVTEPMVAAFWRVRGGNPESWIAAAINAGPLWREYLRIRSELEQLKRKQNNGGM